MEHLIKIAADSIGQLRTDDVYRVLDQNSDNQEALAVWISEKRPDLATEVASCLKELKSMSSFVEKETSSIKEKLKGILEYNQVYWLTPSEMAEISLLDVSRQIRSKPITGPADGDIKWECWVEYKRPQDATSYHPKVSSKPLEIQETGNPELDNVTRLYAIWDKRYRLEWSEDKPYQEGWYWILGISPNKEAEIVNVRRQSAFGNCLCLNGTIPVDDVPNALWAGPITLPVEP